MRQGKIEVDGPLGSNILVEIVDGDFSLGEYGLSFEAVTFSGTGTLDTNTSVLTIGEHDTFSTQPLTIGGPIVGQGTIVKDGFARLALPSLPNWSGKLIIVQGEVSNDAPDAWHSDIDIEVRRGSTSPLAPATRLRVNFTQGFGALTGAGIIEFVAPISIGNGDKSSVFNGVLDEDGGRIFFSTRPGSDPTLSGIGRVGAISSGGTVSPGQSAGILTVESVNMISGTDFEFDIGDATPNYGNFANSGNDVLLLTNLSGLSGDPSAANTIRLYLNIDSLDDGAVFEAGFFLRQGYNPAIWEQATFEVFLRDEQGSELHNGQTYRLLDTARWELNFSLVFRQVRFPGDSVFSSGFTTRLIFSELPPMPAEEQVPLLSWFGLLTLLVAISFTGVLSTNRRS